MKKPLIILTGPTAVGKTALAIRLAKTVGGEIISADSMQVYQYMDIGSAKVRPEEMQGIPHYLIDEISPFEEFHVVRFQAMAKKYMQLIYDRGKIPIVVGGTGFYIQALLYDIDFTESESDKKLRRELLELAEAKGNDYLHQQLLAVDPESAAKIHPNNRKRVIRALEFYRQTGTRISAHNENESQKESPYDFCYFVLNTERALLYERINKRVDQMLADGLAEEVKKLKAMGCNQDMVSMKGIGYKELLAWLDGEVTYEQAVEQLKLDTRHFAKRQLTWFQRERDVDWLYLPDFDHNPDQVLAHMLQIIKNKTGE